MTSRSAARPPVDAKDATWVFPRSSTSGGVLEARAVVIFVAMSVHCWVWTSARRYHAMGKRKVFGLYVRNFWSEILRHRPADHEHLDMRA